MKPSKNVSALSMRLIKSDRDLSMKQSRNARESSTRLSRRGSVFSRKRRRGFARRLLRGRGSPMRLNRLVWLMKLSRRG
jgi:hypothetical protein